MSASLASRSAQAARWLQNHPGASLREAGAVFGVSASSVWSTWQRLGLGERKYAKPGRRLGGRATAAARWLDEHPEGTLESAARAFGVTRSAVGQSWRKLGLEHGGPRARRARLRRAGAPAPTPEIAPELGAGAR